MKLIQKAVIKKGNKYLIALRAPNKKHFPGYWDFPGGNLEPDETPETGVEREVLEETSLVVKALKVIGVYDFDLENKGTSTHRFTIYSVKIISGTVKISEEHTGFRWATKEEILKLKTEPNIPLLFKDYPDL